MSGIEEKILAENQCKQEGACTYWLFGMLRSGIRQCYGPRLLHIVHLQHSLALGLYLAAVGATELVLYQFIGGL
jgi:hypothetical protein